jgi:hypothetical protein
MEFDKIRDAHKKTYEHFATHWENPNPIELELFYEFLLCTSFRRYKLDINELYESLDNLLNYTPAKKYKKQISIFRESRFEFYECYSSIYKIDAFNSRLFFEKFDSLIDHFPMGETAYKSKKDHEKVMDLWMHLGEIAFGIYEIIEGRQNLEDRFHNNRFDPFEIVSFFDQCINIHIEHNLILKPFFGLKKAFRWLNNEDSY